MTHDTSEILVRIEACRSRYHVCVYNPMIGRWLYATDTPVPYHVAEAIAHRYISRGGRRA